MTKYEILDALEQGGFVNYEVWSWNKHSFECSCTEEDYSCCYEAFSSAEEAYEHLLDFVDEDLSEVYM